MSDVAIQVKGVGKQYKIGQRERYKSLRDSLTDAFTAPFRHLAGHSFSSNSGQQQSDNWIWALKDISFEVKRGEAVGIIGRNGAGKSTLLKILSRITEPTEGEVSLKGRVGSLLEVGTGFHPELTGRENIFLNGAILGMMRAEIERKFDEIVAFAGIDTFIDTPVKHYSSGMYMRLAFAVAAHLETEVLLVDEVLAVGDVVFQLKCINKMSEVAGAGRTVLFVTHNMETVTKLCGRGVVLDEGRISRIGMAQECVDYYLLTVREQRAQGAEPVSLIEHPGRTKPHNGAVQLSRLHFLDENGKPTWHVSCGRPMSVVIGYEFEASARPQTTMFAITVSSIYNHRITTWRSNDTYPEAIRIDRPGEVICRIPKLPLRPGSYKVTVGCNSEAGPSDGVYDAAVMEVVGTDFYPSGQIPLPSHGDVLVEHEWQVPRNG